MRWSREFSPGGPSGWTDSYRFMKFALIEHPRACGKRHRHFQHWSSAMPKERNLEDQHDRGDDHGQKDMPKLEPKPGHYPPQKTEHDEDGKTDKSK
jgi:hypothetical protein